MARLNAVASGAILALAMLSVPVAAASSAPAPSFPRGSTLYTSGVMYTPPTNFNPLDANRGLAYQVGPGQASGAAPPRWYGPYAAGTMGLLYETLFLYDPQHQSYLPWLATSGSWQGSNYVLHVRQGVKWSDGAPLTGADVSYTVNLAKTNPAIPWTELVQFGLRGAVASGNTVTVRFGAPPPYAAWQRFLWTAPVLPEHIWSKLSAAAQLSWPNTRPVASGPMLLDNYNSTEVAYRANPNWWASAQLGLHFRFKYLVDTVTGGTGTELTNLLTGDLDWSNAFLPGAANVLSSHGGSSGYNITAYYQSPPYMLPAGTAWLVPNTGRAPMNGIDFRRSLAWALSPPAIADQIYPGPAPKVSPTGLPTLFKSYIDEDVVTKYGFKYDPGLAKSYLKLSGYKGQVLNLTVPAGLDDLKAAAGVIARQLLVVGIKVKVSYASYSNWEEDLATGQYELTIAGQAALDATPWGYFDRVYALPIGGTADEQVAGLNPERFSDPAAWALVKRAGTIPPAETATLKRVYSQLEKAFLQDLPVVPVWYGLAWAQGNITHWGGYPSSADKNDQNTPVMWTGWLGATTTVLALAKLRLAKH
jgi:peptide/nickel transport system substrate-binding protein